MKYEIKYEVRNFQGNFEYEADRFDEAVEWALKTEKPGESFSIFKIINTENFMGTVTESAYHGKEP